MAVLASFAAMGVVVILRMGLAVVHIVIGVVIEFVKGLAPVQAVAQHFADDVQSRLFSARDNTPGFPVRRAAWLATAPTAELKDQAQRPTPLRGRLQAKLVACSMCLRRMGSSHCKDSWLHRDCHLAQDSCRAGIRLVAMVFRCAGILTGAGIGASFMWRERAAQGLAAPQGAAIAAPLMAAASAPEEIRVLVI